VFFSGTIEGEAGITHCGIYVGNNKMLHCGNPCSYADLTEAYWQQHFAGYGRVY
jgi:cell wall-associated NlpC family hydrolase